ncbi:MAG: FAD-dependent monooxygenase, partial [Pseudomonadales bacterium]|nr:FAD-dependent monooxygenase [Pseudomonadales bacterium]
GADGRSSAVRKWVGFEVKHERQRRFFGGVLMDDVKAPEDTMYSRFAPDEGLMSWIFPQGNGRVRTYIGYHADTDFERLNGERDIGRFIETAEKLGVPSECFANAKVAGPLATFDATDNWVEHPYRDGIALIGDAASTSDPTWGQGMSLALRDVRVLYDKLSADEDWNAAGHAYAEEHDRGYTAIRTVDSWYTDILLDIGPEAEARRARALPKLAEDRTRIPDTPLEGPHLEPSEEMRKRFFGEDA